MLRCYIPFWYSCWSYVGMYGGRQQISLGQGCWYKGTTAHEIGKLVNSCICRFWKKVPALKVWLTTRFYTHFAEATRAVEAEEEPPQKKERKERVATSKPTNSLPIRVHPVVKDSVHRLPWSATQRSTNKDVYDHLRLRRRHTHAHFYRDSLCPMNGSVFLFYRLGHALGFYHEQSRPDRDLYVKIMLENIYDGISYNLSL